MPSGATFVSATGNWTYSAGVVSWDLGNLGVGENGSVSFTVTLGSYGTYQNSADLFYDVGLNGFTETSNTTSTVYDADTDGDGIADSIDICPNDYNPAQDLSSDILSCGACGVVCAVANGTPACAGGTCIIASCNSGWSDCNGQYADGCEYDNSNFATDENNCGGCGVYTKYGLSGMYFCKNGAAE